MPARKRFSAKSYKQLAAIFPCRCCLMAQFEVYKDNDRLFRWRLRTRDNRLIAESCEGFYNRSDCENAVILVRNEASKADLILNNT